MSPATRALVRERAKNCCEYCGIHQDESPLAALHVEHIRPLKHGGGDDLSNLCLACIDCNLHKGSDLTGIDPVSGTIAELFNPRLQRWDEHFHWEGIRIAGKTGIGRTTVRVLCMNSDDQLELRMSGDL